MVIIQQLISGSMLGGIYVMVAVAFTLVIGMLNFLNFTIPPIFMLSAMVSWAVAKFGLPFGIMAPPVHWLFALIVGIFVAIIASLIVERFTYRYLKNRYGDATEHAIPLVSSIGFLLIFPITRKLILSRLSSKLKPRKNEKNNFIDGEFEDIENDDDRKI